MSSMEPIHASAPLARAEDTPKEKRLRSLARRAGALSVSAYLGGNRDRAYFFLNKMNKILKMVRDFHKGQTNA